MFSCQLNNETLLNDKEANGVGARDHAHNGSVAKERRPYDYGQYSNLSLLPAEISYIDLFQAEILWPTTGPTNPTLA